jgi:hypothetical protein
VGDSFMDNEWSEATGWASLQRWVFGAQNSTAGVPASCLAVHAAKGEAWKCFMAQFAAPSIETPLFALQPMCGAMHAPRSVVHILASHLLSRSVCLSA